MGSWQINTKVSEVKLFMTCTTVGLGAHKQSNPSAICLCWFPGLPMGALLLHNCCFITATVTAAVNSLCVNICIKAVLVYMSPRTNPHDWRPANSSLVLHSPFVLNPRFLYKPNLTTRRPPWARASSSAPTIMQMTCVQVAFQFMDPLRHI